MKRVLILFALFATLVTPSFAFAGQVSAVDVFPNCGAGSAGNKTPEVCTEVKSERSKTNPIVRLISQIIMVVSYVIGVAAVIGILLSGYRFMTANGDASSVAAARKGLLYALIGLFVAFISGFLVSYVIDKT